ncbi:hypothetical protein DL769_006221 [Monosporascus sp. CRB-8-3]|nr:hypothetical protein DL769_006221 [Monosporascus sp. CRB-8-3]
MTTSLVERLTRRALLVVTELRGAKGLTADAYKNIVELLGLGEDDRLTRALLVVTELRSARGLTLPPLVGHWSPERGHTLAPDTLEAYKNIFSLLGLDEEGFPLTNGATTRSMDHQACLTDGQVNTKRETTAEGDSGVEGHEPVTTASISTGSGVGTPGCTAATKFIGIVADTTAGITAGATASTSIGIAADTAAGTVAANSTGISDGTGAAFTHVVRKTDPSQELIPCAPIAVSRREDTARNHEIRKAMANDSIPKRESADPVFVDEEADNIRKSEYLESCKTFSPSDRHHLAKPGELALVASDPHDILVQTPDGDIVWRQSAELFRRAEAMPHERVRPSFDKNFTKCNEEGNLMVDDHRHPVVIQETMLKNTELSKRNGAETVVAPKREIRQDHRLKKDGEVIIRWTENEIAVLKLNGDRVIRRAPEQFVRSYNLVNPTVPEKADDLEYRTCDAEGYQLKDAYGREAVLAETLRAVGPSMRAEKPRTKRTTMSGKGLKGSMHNR